jgi:uncharacterized protein YgbK (DUF1537 family)
MIALGCIADDFTGGTDVAAALRRAGMRVALLFGQPDANTEVPPTDAVVIALKTRTVPAAEAVAQSLAALAWLEAHGLEKLYFKYCSTFDSTDDGNIGPVTDALLDALDEPITLICPASPEHGRTTYLGHHFVGDKLLSESSMRHHPLTPMTDPDLRRMLARQTDGTVGHLRLPVVRSGADAVTSALKQAREGGTRHVVVDAVADDDLATVAAGSRDVRLLTGGAGFAGALGAALRTRPTEATAEPTLPAGPGIALAGSCSAATLAQVAHASRNLPSYRLDPAATPDPERMLDQARSWLRKNWQQGPLVIYSSAGPEDREQARRAMGPDTSEILELVLGQLAREAVQRGAVRIAVAGGETSGAVVQALGVASVLVAREADRGVPWCLSLDHPPVALLLKSGNFGSEDLLTRALQGVPR